MEGLANNNGTWMSLMPVTEQAVAPHFYYQETFESGDVFRGVSAGNGKFVDFKAVWPVPVLSFSVEKNRVHKTISIDVHSTTLQQHICRAIFAGSTSVDLMLLSFDIILQHYDALKCFLELLETQSPTALQTLELRLLVRDLLLDRAVFDGIGVEVYRDRDLVSLLHLHDIHQRSVDAGLDEIDDCFSLGLVPDNISNEYLSEFNVRYSDLAVNGDYTGLFNLCEPIVRSGDIELQYNPALLLQVLDKGLLEIYRYLLDLVSRTRENSAKVPGSQLPDVTYDPLHVAIRLGHIGKVRSLLDEGSTFEGHFSDETAVGRHHPVFTPISAAVFWRRPDIVRLLLSRGAFEQAELQKAVTIAISNDLADIMKVILESGTISSQDVSAIPAIGCGLPNQDYSIKLHPELVVTGQNPQNGLAAYEDDRAMGHVPSESAQVNVQELRDSLGKQPRQPPAAPKTTASVRRKGLKFLRQKLGRELTVAVNSLCSRIREYCGGYPAGSAMSEVGGQFKSFGAVWQRGMEVIRRIMQNQPPDELVSVLDCLLVASSMCSALNESDDQLHVQFINDLGRWRTVLGPTDQQLFDDITFALWAYTDVPESKPALERTESLYTFQELVQQLVLLEKDASRAARGGRRSGRRLDMIQREISQQNTQPGISGPEPISIASNGVSQAHNGIAGSESSSRKRRFDGFSFADMLNLELFEDGPAEPIEESMHSEQCFDWKDILPLTVLLLASVAFSIIFTMVIVLHVGSQDSPAAIIQQLGPGYARSTAILEEYLDIVHNRASRFRGSMSSRQSSLAGPAQSFGSYASALSQQHGDFATPPSGVSSLDPSELRLASTSTTSHFSGSQIPALSSPEALRPGTRLSCPSPHCPKTFSNVSNRNKHMREGCAYREKRGYRCRNPSCSKVLTTKWYRDTHERERCRFR